MATRSEKIRLGVFLTAAVILFIGTVAVLTGMEIWEERHRYVIHFEQSVSGLETGSPVKQRGVRVGYVERIRVNPENLEQVQVWVNVRKDTPIKTDTKAYINMQGITGMKFIELQGGTKEAKRLPARSEIQPGTSTIQELTGRATDISLKFEKLLNNFLSITRPENRRRVDAILEKTDNTLARYKDVGEKVEGVMEKTDTIMRENRRGLREAIQSVDETTDRLNATLGRVNSLVDQTSRTIDESDVPGLVTGVKDTNKMLQERIAQIDFKQAINNTTAALETFQRVLDELSQTIGQNQNALRITLHNFRIMSENLKELSQTFQEKPYIQIFGDNPKERKLP
jgi:phospholipid/cholesterol/gamma-HCH transport system substrate-binding protein